MAKRKAGTKKTKQAGNGENGGIVSLTQELFQAAITLRGSVEHRDDVLAELRERLRATGIEPIGATDHVPSLVERRVWAPPASDNGSLDDVEETLRRAVSTDGKSV